MPWTDASRKRASDIARERNAERLQPIEPTFWAKVDRSGGDAACWPWIGWLRPDGYGVFESRRMAGRRRIRAHRMAYELLVGPIPAGAELDHLCRNPKCVNPAHLEPVTHAENLHRSKVATRTHCVHGHPFSAENTYYRPDWPNTRQCKACGRDRKRAKAAA